MDPLEAIDALARKARQETPPRSDLPVAALVRRLQRTAVPETPVLAVLSWSAGISALAACLVLVISLRVGTTASATSGSSAVGTTTVASASMDALFTPVQVELP